MKKFLKGFGSFIEHAMEDPAFRAFITILPIMLVLNITLDGEWNFKLAFAVASIPFWFSLLAEVIGFGLMGGVAQYLDSRGYKVAHALVPLFMTLRKDQARIDAVVEAMFENLRKGKDSTTKEK